MLSAVRPLLPLLALLTLTPGADALRLVLLSDFNGSYGSTTYPPALQKTVQCILNDWKPDLVISAGDLIAGQQASLSAKQVQAMWHSFEQNVNAPLRNAGIPFAFTLGNHDASLPSDRVQAASYWKAHAPELQYADKTGFPFTYSFTVQNIFVAVLDASGPNVDAVQRRWLTAQLATPAARSAKFRLVMGHLPLAGVSQGKNRLGEVIRDAASLRQVMQQGNVTAYLHGHHAAYYPGRLAGLNVLSSGGIGGRDYVGFPGTARSVVTVLDVGQDSIQLTAYDADTGKVIPSASLPARIDGLNGPLTRITELR